jgi:hypothetical protein
VKGPIGAERGSVSIEAVFAIGFLLIPAAALLAQLPGWIGVSHAAQAAAVEATRQVALAETMAEGIVRAQAVASEVVANHGFDASELVGVEVEATPSGELQRGQLVTVTVTVRGSPILVPGLGSVGNPFNAAGAATERVDDYRSFEP